MKKIQTTSIMNLIRICGFLFAFISTISEFFNELTASSAAYNAGKAAYKSIFAASFSLLIDSAYAIHAALVISHSSFLIFASYDYLVTFSKIALV